MKREIWCDIPSPIGISIWYKDHKAYEGHIVLEVASSYSRLELRINQDLPAVPV